MNAPAPAPALSERMKALLVEYGKVAVTIYLVIFALVFVAAAIAIQAGFELDGASGQAGTLAAAWVATKLTQPLRILATLALTPLVAAIGAKIRGKVPRSPS